MILDHVVLPVIDCSVSFNLLSFQVYIFYIHAGIVLKVSKGYFMKFLSK